MDYVSLTTDELRNLTANRLKELEIHHFNYTLEEREEPGRSSQRAASLVDLEQRISRYRKELGLNEEMGGEPSERGDDEVAQP